MDMFFLIINIKNILEAGYIMKHFELILAAALCAPFFAGNTSFAAAKAPVSAEKKSEAVWLTDLEAAKKQAAKENKPILMFFTGSDWCGWCQKLHEDVLDKDEFQKFAKDSVILLELDFPSAKKQSDALKKQNAELGKKFDVSGYPTMVLVKADGETEIDRNVGYSKELVSKLKSALEKGGSAAKKAPAKEPAAKKTDDAWLTDFEAAKKQAVKEDKPILMFFTGSDWCGWCQKLHTDVLDKDEFQKFAKDNLVLLELDFPNSIPQSAELKKQNSELGKKFKVDGYPTMVLVEPDGKTEIDRTVGYSKDLVKSLKNSLKKRKSGSKKKPSKQMKWE